MDAEDHLSSGFWSMDLKPRQDQQAIDLNIPGDGTVSIDEVITAAPETTETSKGLHVEEREKRWEVLKDNIYRLYVEGGKTLPATMAAIQKMYDFTASPRTWKTKIKEWGFEKYMSKNDMTFVVAKADQRTMEGKETVFYYRGLEISASKIKNFRRRQKTTGTSVSCPQNAATPYFITYGTPNTDELDAAIVDERPADYHETDGPLDESDVTARSKDDKDGFDLASLNTIPTQPHISPELCGTSFSNDLLLARCDQLLRSWVRTKTEGYPLLLLLENFHFEGILLDMDMSMDPSDLTLEFLLKRWIQHENEDTCVTCMSSTDESMCIGGILASAEIPDQRINKCRDRLLDFLEQAPVEHESVSAKITTYSNLLQLYGIQFGDCHPSMCRFRVALAHLYLNHQPESPSLLSKAESLLITTVTKATRLKDLCLQFKCQLMLARCHIRNKRYYETINILSQSFTDFLTINRTERFDTPIFCIHPDPPDVERKLMSSSASFSHFPGWNPSSCWEYITESIHRIWKLVQRNPNAHLWSNKDHFKLRTEIATITQVVSNLGFFPQVQRLFWVLITAADPEDTNVEEAMMLWNVKIYTHVLHYHHVLHSSIFSIKQCYAKQEVCSSLIHQAANFLKGNVVHHAVAEEFNELQDMFAGLYPTEPWSEEDRSSRIGDLQSQKEPQTVLFPHKVLGSWPDWDESHGRPDKIDYLAIDEFDDLLRFYQKNPTTANNTSSFPVLPIAAWNESGELEDVLAPLEHIAAASAGSGYQASRSQGSIISESRMSTNSTSSGMKSVKYGVTYSEGSVMSLDLTDLFP